MIFKANQMVGAEQEQAFNIEQSRLALEQQQTNNLIAAARLEGEQRDQEIRSRENLLKAAEFEYKKNNPEAIIKDYKNVDVGGKPFDRTVDITTGKVIYEVPSYVASSETKVDSPRDLFNDFSTQLNQIDDDARMSAKDEVIRKFGSIIVTDPEGNPIINPSYQNYAEAQKFYETKQLEERKRRGYPAIKQTQLFYYNQLRRDAGLEPVTNESFTGEPVLDKPVQAGTTGSDIVVLDKEPPPPPAAVTLFDAEMKKLQARSDYQKASPETKVIIERKLREKLGL